MDTSEASSNILLSLTSRICWILYFRWQWISPRKLTYLNLPSSWVPLKTKSLLIPQGNWPEAAYTNGECTIFKTQRGHNVQCFLVVGWSRYSKEVCTLESPSACPVTPNFQKFIQTVAFNFTWIFFHVLWRIGFHSSRKCWNPKRPKILKDQISKNVILKNNNLRTC